MINMLRAPVDKIRQHTRTDRQRDGNLKEKTMPKIETETKSDFLGSLIDWTWKRSWSLRMYK